MCFTFVICISYVVTAFLSYPPCALTHDPLRLGYAGSSHGGSHFVYALDMLRRNLDKHSVIFYAYGAGMMPS